MSIALFLQKQSTEALSCTQVLVGVHLILGHPIEKIAEDTDISKIKVSQIASFLQSENLIDLAIEPITKSSTGRLSSFVEATIQSTQPKTARKAQARPKTKRKSTNTRNMSPTELEVSEWMPKHVLDYFTIRWCEQSWKTPPPRWQAKDRANAKRLQEDYAESIKKIIDFIFDNWPNLKAKFNIEGLPSISILWGFRNSIVPLALGDATENAKSWGSSHDTNQDRDDGDELGW